MHTYVTHRRLGAGSLHKPPKVSNTWYEKPLSLLLIAASIALGLACIVALVRTFQNSSFSIKSVSFGGSAGDIKAAVTATAHSQAAATADDSAKRTTELSAADIARLRKAAKILDAELMQHVPEAFESGVKNHCWTTNNGDFRCLPYFYITGQFHSGAMSLSEKLRQHPDVVWDSCSGCQFWGEEGKSMAFYLENLKEAPKIIKQAPTTKVLMDSSASTFAFYWAAAGKSHRGYADFMKPCYQGCVKSYDVDKTPVPICMSAKCYNGSLKADVKRAEEAGIKWDTEAHNPLLLRAVYGERPPKMILVAREPISRLYSAFHGYPHYNGKYGKNSAGFTAYVEEQVTAFRACAADYGDTRCALYFEALGHREEQVYFHADQLMRSMYGLFLEIWYRFLPSQHWLVIDADDLFHRPKETLQQVVKFLDLSPVDDVTLELMAAAGKPNSFTTGQEPIQPVARQMLAELFKPYNSKLAQLTGDMRFEKWNEQAGGH